MKRNILLIAIVPLTALLFMCKSTEKVNESGKKFVIRTGVNVSHWLSQSERRGDERREYITQADFDTIVSMGFDHVRIPIDEEQMWDSLGNQETEAFELLHNAIQWALQVNLRVIVDLHIIRSHYFNAESNALWTDPAEQEKLIDMWYQLSDALKKYPTHMLAYEIMNEAVAEDPEDWNSLLGKAISAIRSREPARVIVVGSNMWQIASTFPDLRVPEKDTNILLSFHFYTPGAFTHHKASWTSFAEYEGPVNYPGWIVDTSYYSELSPATVAVMREHANGYFDKDTLRQVMMPAIEIADSLNLPLFCGEYGVYPTIDEELSLRWYKDVCAIFNENNIAYCHWGYRGDFPVVDSLRTPNLNLVDVLTME